MCDTGATHVRHMCDSRATQVRHRCGACTTLCVSHDQSQLFLGCFFCHVIFGGSPSLSTVTILMCMSVRETSCVESYVRGLFWLQSFFCFRSNLRTMKLVHGHYTRSEGRRVLGVVNTDWLVVMSSRGGLQRDEACWSRSAGRRTWSTSRFLSSPSLAGGVTTS